MRTLLVLVVVVTGIVTGCKSKEPAATAKSCAAAVAKTALPSAQKADLEAACLETKWSSETLACFDTAKDPVTCKEKMSPEQRGAYTRISAEGDAAAEALAAKQKAEEAAAQSVKDAAEAQQVVERLEQDSTDLQKRITESVDAVVGAQSQADRDAAKAKLEEMQKQKAELDARIAEAKAKAAGAERTKGIGISKECLENPLAKGCS